jgi:hypothetical protein
VAHAWLPGARRIRARVDGGPLKGGSPRAVWLTLGTASGSVSVQSAATRLMAEGRPCHLIWDPVTGEVAQLISILRAGCALTSVGHLAASCGLPDDGNGHRGATARVTSHPPGLRAGTARSAPASVRGGATTDVNTEGRVCVQIGVLGHPADPFTSGPLAGAAMIVSWLDSWSVPRHWPAGQPSHAPGRAHDASAARTASSNRALWALGGHFGACQVPGCATAGPGRIDTTLLTGTHMLQLHQWEPRYRLSTAVLPIPA